MAFKKRPVNPCTFKAACKRCTMAGMEDRPSMCKSLECEFYTPCPKCGMNKNLEDNDLCERCDKLKNVIVTKADGTQEEEEDLGSTGFTGEKAESETDFGDNGRDVLVAIPGNPPPNLNQDEKEYYIQRWEQYEGYYRDPVAYIVCHYMILEEINLNYITHMIIYTRGDRSTEYEKQKAKSLETLGKLKSQLPEKESEALSDDEKALGRVYEAYIEEKKLQTHGDVTRFFSQEAIALAPVLVHKTDPAELLRRAGYNVSEINDALERCWTNDDKEMSAVDALKFFGFKVKEEYALPFETGINQVEKEVVSESELEK